MSIYFNQNAQEYEYLGFNQNAQGYEYLVESKRFRVWVSTLVKTPKYMSIYFGQDT